MKCKPGFSVTDCSILFCEALIIVIIRDAAITDRISHGVISLNLAPQPCALSLTVPYYPVRRDYGDYS